MTKKKNGWGKKHRAVIVTGVRTPFVKAFGKFLKLDSIDLADIAVQALLERTDLPHDEIDSIVWGGVILPALAPNIAREIALTSESPILQRFRSRRRLLLLQCTDTMYWVRSCYR